MKALSKFLYNHLKNSEQFANLVERQESRIKRLMIEIDLGEHSDEVTSCLGRAVSKEAFSHKLLKLLCENAFSDGYLGIDTKYLFSDAFISYLKSEHFLKQSSTKQSAFVRSLIDSTIDTNLALHLLKSRRISLNQVPSILISESFLIEAVKSNVMCFYDIQEKDLTERIAISACEIDGYFINHIPEGLLTKDVCVSALNSNPSSISKVPDKFITAEFAQSAVKHNGLNLKFIPSELKTKQICFTALVNEPRCFKFINEEYIDNEFLLSAIKANVDVYRHLPGTIQKDFEFRLEACEVSRGAVVKNFRMVDFNEVLIKRAIELNFLTLREIPHELLSAEIAIHAAKIRGESVMYLPSDLISREVLELACLTFPYAIAVVNKSLLDEQLVLQAVKIDYKVFASLPKEFLTVKVLTEVIRQNGCLLSYVNQESRTEDVCLAALTNGHEALRLIPDDLLNSSKFWNKALELNSGLITFIPPKHKSKIKTKYSHDEFTP